MSALSDRHCTAGAVPRLSNDAIPGFSSQLEGWTVRDGTLARSFKLKDFKAAMAFVNALADVANQEDHHPDFAVHYDRVDLTLSTHSAGGLTENDFILAAKIDRLAR